LVHLTETCDAAISLHRLDDWWTLTLRVPTRTSRFAALAAGPHHFSECLACVLLRVV
jgi:hypothetical protein